MYKDNFMIHEKGRNRMSKKKVVSIEDRIPKLKQARKRKANRRLIFYLSIFFILISIIVYLQSPLSHIKYIHVVGNSLVSTEDILAKSELTKQTNIWSVDREKTKQIIEELTVVEEAKVIRKLPWTIEIHISEYERVGYVKDHEVYLPILGNGETLPFVDKPLGDAPLLIGFSDESYLNRMATQLGHLSKPILNLISEIHWNPIEENPNKIILYMNDGFIVNSSIRDFAQKMEVYPSITAQLDPNEKGIIHIGVGAYFEKFTPADQSEEEQEQGESTESTD